jgi:two-component system LytT family sensor kinase
MAASPAAGSMAMLPFTPTPFFADKNRAFWRLQLLGWGGYALQRAVSALANDLPWDILVPVLISAITGFSISVILSVIYGWLIRQRALVTWSVTVLVLAVAVSLYSFINAWVLQLYDADGQTSFVQRFVGIVFYDLTVLGAWSALYYAIN